MGLNLGAIQRDMAQAYHPSHLAEAQDQHEKAFQRIEIASPELTDAAVWSGCWFAVCTRKARSLLQARSI